MSRGALLVLLSLCCAVPSLSHAQVADADGGDDAGEVIEDAGTSIDAPDGSVGEGGADRDNPEGEDSTGRVPSTCIQSLDCAPQFRCQNGRCTYVGYRDAEGGLGCGCASTTAPPLLMLAAGLTFAARRRRHRVLHSQGKFPGIR